jgi:hypothetical protein
MTNFELLKRLFALDRDYAVLVPRSVGLQPTVAKVSELVIGEQYYSIPDNDEYVLLHNVAFTYVYIVAGGPCFGCRKNVVKPSSVKLEMKQYKKVNPPKDREEQVYDVCERTEDVCRKAEDAMEAYAKDIRRMQTPRPFNPGYADQCTLTAKTVADQLAVAVSKAQGCDETRRSAVVDKVKRELERQIKEELPFIGTDECIDMQDIEYFHDPCNWTLFQLHGCNKTVVSKSVVVIPSSFIEGGLSIVIRVSHVGKRVYGKRTCLL